MASDSSEPVMWTWDTLLGVSLETGFDLQFSAAVGLVLVMG